MKDILKVFGILIIGLLIGYVAGCKNARLGLTDTSLIRHDTFYTKPILVDSGIVINHYSEPVVIYKEKIKVKLVEKIVTKEVYVDNLNQAKNCTDSLLLCNEYVSLLEKDLDTAYTDNKKLLDYIDFITTNREYKDTISTKDYSIGVRIFGNNVESAKYFVTLTPQKGRESVYFIPKAGFLNNNQFIPLLAMELQYKAVSLEGLYNINNNKAGMLIGYRMKF